MKICIHGYGNEAEQTTKRPKMKMKTNINNNMTKRVTKASIGRTETATHTKHTQRRSPIQ